MIAAGRYDGIARPETQRRMAERIRMMEEQEMREWKTREEDIEKLQAERLDLLKQLLTQRDLNKTESIAYDPRFDPYHLPRAHT